MLPELVSFLGLVVFIAAGWMLSTNRRLFPWRTVFWGLVLQFLFAVVILKTTVGRHLFELGGTAITHLNQFAAEGSKMVFGSLADEATTTKLFGAPVLAIIVTGTIILVASLSSLLYHWGVLQRVVQAMAWVMRRAMGTSGSETLAAAANIFMGQTEAPLVIKPYIARMTRSELMCLMTGGMATIAGGVAAVYADFGRRSGHPSLAGHLLTASVMSAPAALLIAKVMHPETEPSETAHGAPMKTERPAANSLDALVRGATDGLMLALNVIAMLICFVAIVTLANWLFTWPQIHLGVAHPLKLEQILGWANAPCAWLMGVPVEDCGKIGEILGQRIVLNEFVGYLNLTAPDTAVSDRAFNLTVYALCGFANFGSIAVQIGGIGALVPERRSDLARLAVRAMIGGLLACYLTATVVGILM